MRVWYKRFEYINNVKIIWTLKLLTEIKKFNTNYDSAKIYSNFEISKLENSISKNIDLPF